MRTIFIYLMIAALLLCPYECAVRQVAAQLPVNDAHSACCERCRVRQADESTIPDQKPLPAPTEDGRSCLCEGAVFDGAARSPFELSLQSVLWVEAGDSAIVPVHGLSVVSFDRGNSPLPEDSGRLTRIAIRSLLL